jgi:hypothetical protein
MQGLRAGINTAALNAALIVGSPALATAGGWYLMAPELPDVYVRTQKNVGLGDIEARRPAT